MQNKIERSCKETNVSNRDANPLSSKSWRKYLIGGTKG